jgi:Transposase DDE domain
MNHFRYDELNDTYTCPQQQVLITNGNWYKKSKDSNHYVVKHYKTNACQVCPARALCTKNKKGRVIERSEYAPYVEINRLNIEADPATYKKRQSIAEHPYGTIKRQWGFCHIITKKGTKRASADAGFMFIAYNLRRMINILDKNVFMKFLQELVFLFLRKKASLKCFIAKLKHLFSSAILPKHFYMQHRIASY